jgi:hypothetical protein
MLLTGEGIACADSVCETNLGELYFGGGEDGIVAVVI